MRAAAILLCALLLLPIACNKPAKQAEDAAWWGKYESGDMTLGISNYDGKSFTFSFWQGQSTEFSGVAAIDPDNFFSAVYMDLIFELDKDAKAVTVTQHENREDKEARTPFTGVYLRD